MSDEAISLAHCLTAPRPSNTAIACHRGHYYRFNQFHAAVGYWVNRLRSEPFQRYALYTEDAYPFAVLLFALFHADKEAWIPGNNRPGTAQQLQQQECRLLGDWETGKPFDYGLKIPGYADVLLAPLNLETTRLVIFTSGSTGHPKPIEKRLIQFQLETAVLEKRWGEQLDKAEALSTVSHQHIYGLLFRVFWPLSAGRCFHSHIFFNPETLINNSRHAAYWIASPAHLKRLDQQSPWDGIAGLNAIFSSGGALQQSAAQQIKACSGQAVIEIFGSSETGGIAWRQQDEAWRLFEDMDLQSIDGRWRLHSPFLKDESVQLDDQITMQADGKFILHGRLDRIVKLEEKRLSLTAMEQRLLESPWVMDAYTIMISRLNRDVVAAVVALNQDGLQMLETQGRKALIQHLRATLSQWFDNVVLPRKWVFSNTIPLTAQGKIDKPLLMQLVDADNNKLPQVLGFEITEGGVELAVKVCEDLLYFPDHFAGYPILPGVVQIAWVEHFGKLFFAINTLFSHMEVIKFVKVIQPGNRLKLTLTWKSDACKLYFSFSSELGVHSSGRMVYGEKS